MKKLLLALGLMAAMPAFSMPMLCDIVSGAACLDDTGDELFQVIDTDGSLDTITSFVFSRSASLSNTLFFYDIDDSTNQLEVFSGTSPAGSAATVQYTGGGNYSVIGGGSSLFASGSMFGIGVNTGQNTWYSQTSLNSDGFDHLLVFDTLGNTPSTGLLNVANLTFAWEDLVGGGDKDYNDIVATCIDCEPKGPGTTTTDVPVPAPLTLMAMGLGLLGLRRVATGS